MLKSKVFLIILSFFILSCASRKDIVNFQYDQYDQNEVTNDYQLKFKPDDLLQIIVSADDIESAQPFNLPLVATSKIGDRLFSSQPQIQPYLIDAKGYIDFPVIGRLKLAGLTRSQAIKMMKNKLSPSFLKNPIININIANFKFTVLGDVRNPGTFSVTNERLSLIDAIGLAGGLNISARRDNILLIREENGSKKQYRINLLSNSIFNSTAYYLEQNDVLYVEPNNSKIQDAAYTRNTGLFISLASVLISLLTIITR